MISVVGTLRCRVLNFEFISREEGDLLSVESVRDGARLRYCC